MSGEEPKQEVPNSQERPEKWIDVLTLPVSLAPGEYVVGVRVICRGEHLINETYILKRDRKGELQEGDRLYDITINRLK